MQSTFCGIRGHTPPFLYMEIRWEQVSDTEFEQIVAALMRAMEWENVVVRTGGGDGGWDIDAQRLRTDPDGRRHAERWKVECKRYRGAVTALKVRDHFRRMVETDPVPDRVLFATSGSLSNDVKDDLERAAKKERVGVGWWERAELTHHVLEHLSAEPLRRLVAPYIDLAIPPSLLAEGAARQVQVEIERRVGKKYLAQLYRGRGIEAEMAAFLAADADALALDDMIFLAVELAPGTEEWSRVVEEMADCGSGAQAAELLRAAAQARMPADRARLLDDEIARRLSLVRNCFLIKERAGSGKTNLLCRMALEPPVSGVTLFLSCRFDPREYVSLEAYLLASLRAAMEPLASPEQRLALPHDPALFLQSLVLTLEREGRPLIIFLDGINEARDLEALNESILSLLQRWNGFPVKFVVTCRDIFWDFFDDEEWSRFLYRNNVFSLPEFTVQEVDALIGSYFRFFNIRGRLVGIARDRCRHPLLLRFFCEAYQGQDIREYEDLRLKDLFDEYWARKRQEIGEGLGLGQQAGARMERFLFRLVGHMLDCSSLQVSVREVAEITGEEDLETPRSLYRRLLDQDIILEELPPEQALDRSYAARKVAFVYDEFYDYVAARSHVHRRGWDALAPVAIAADFARLLGGARRFEQLVGVAEYLVLIAEAAGLHRLLCAVLARLGEVDLLCSVLPKLKEVDAWAPEALRVCLYSADEIHGGIAGRRTDAIAALLESAHEDPLEQHVLHAPLPEPADPNPRVVLDTIEDGVRPGMNSESLINHWQLHSQTYTERWHHILDSRGTGMMFPSLPAESDSLGFGWFIPKIWLPEPAAVERRVADTVWTLWSHTVNRVWEILLDWVAGDTRLVGVAREVIRKGFQNQSLNAADALAVMDGWFKDGSRENVDAAAKLMPAFPPAELLTAYDQWAAIGADGASNALPAVMRHLFIVEPVRTLQMVHRWVLVDARHDRAVAASLAAVDVPGGGTEDLYAVLDKMLLVLSARVRRRSPNTDMHLKRLLAQSRAERSRLGNQRSRTSRSRRAGRP
jgi:hypothetical protein